MLIFPSKLCVNLSAQERHFSLTIVLRPQMLIMLLGMLCCTLILRWIEPEIFHHIFNQGVSLARRFALVPLGPPLLAYKSTCRAMLTAVDDAVQFVVDRPYKAGEPIVVW